MITLQNWSTISTEDPYIAPELRTLRLQGDAYGHPKFPDGHYIKTSGIKNFKGRIVYTHSKNNSVYKLGKIDPNFRKFLKKTRPNWDWRHPIKWI